MQVIYHPEAELELIEAARYYEARVAGLGADFLDAIDAAASSVASDPERFPTVEEDIRRCRLKRFPFCIFYRIQPDVIRILVVKHHSRTSDYWKARK